MQQEVADIYICEMQLLTCNLFHCKIEISLFLYFSLFHFVLNHQRRRTNEEYDDVGFSHILFKLIYFKFVFLWRAQDGRLFYLDYLIKKL